MLISYSLIAYLEIFSCVYFVLINCIFRDIFSGVNLVLVNRIFRDVSCVNLAARLLHSAGLLLNKLK